jgi:hypothetical protein
MIFRAEVEPGGDGDDFSADGAAACFAQVGSGGGADGARKVEGDTRQDQPGRVGGELSRRCSANAAWLVLAAMAFNLTRSAAAAAGNGLAKARTGTIRRKLIGVPARIASSARKQRLHLPAD